MLLSVSPHIYQYIAVDIIEQLQASEGSGLERVSAHHQCQELPTTDKVFLRGESSPELKHRFSLPVHRV